MDIIKILLFHMKERFNNYLNQNIFLSILKGIKLPI